MPFCLFSDSYNVNSAQELSARERHEISDVLKGHARWNTENHKFFKPTDVVHITKVYNLTLESLGMNEDLSLESANFKTGIEEGNYLIYQLACNFVFVLESNKFPSFEVLT